MAISRIVFMFIHTTHKDRCPINTELPTSNFHRAEANIEGFGFNGLTLWIYQGHRQAIKIGLLCTPQARRIHRQIQMASVVITAFLVDLVCTQRIDLVGQHRDPAFLQEK